MAPLHIAIEIATKLGIEYDPELVALMKGVNEDE
jgi:hypothetical protein